MAGAGAFRTAIPVDARSDELATPPFGAVTNGLAAVSWVPVFDLPANAAPVVLQVFAAEHIPACFRPRRRWSRPAPHAVVRLWTDVASFTRAEDLLRRLLAAPSPLRDAILRLR